MIIVVDSNILFSTCLAAEKQSKFSEIIFSRSGQLKFISCYYAVAELFKHQEKLIKLSGLNAEKLSVLLYEILKQVEFYNEDTIEPANWLKADDLTKAVDSKDISFVALTLQTGGILWTGDKKLSTHLKKSGFTDVINTAELYELLNNT